MCLARGVREGFRIGRKVSWVNKRAADSLRLSPGADEHAVKGALYLPHLSYYCLQTEGLQ